MKTHIALVLVTTALGLALGCGSSGGGGATAPVGSSGAHSGGETDGHPHDDASEGAADGDDHGHAGPGAADPARDTCAEIAELCHDVDESNADAHECHVIGHSHGGGAGCDEHLEHCRAACTAAPSSGHADHAH